MQNISLNEQKVSKYRAFQLNNFQGIRIQLFKNKLKRNLTKILLL